MSNVEFKYELGVKLRDRLSGFEGIVDVRAEYLNGCIRYSVQPLCSKDKPAELPCSYWIDEQQLEKVNDGVNKKPIKKSPRGGPVECSNNAKFNY